MLPRPSRALFDSIVRCRDWLSAQFLLYQRVEVIVVLLFVRFAIVIAAISSGAGERIEFASFQYLKAKFGDMNFGPGELVMVAQGTGQKDLDEDVLGIVVLGREAKDNGILNLHHAMGCDCN